MTIQNPRKKYIIQALEQSKDGVTEQWRCLCIWTLNYQGSPFQSHYQQPIQIRAIPKRMSIERDQLKCNHKEDRWNKENNKHKFWKSGPCSPALHAHYLNKLYIWSKNYYIKKRKWNWKKGINREIMNTWTSIHQEMKH
jgi:hypothetical protein